MRSRFTRHKRRAMLSVLVSLVALLVVAPAWAADPLDPLLGDPGTTLPNLVPDVRTAAITQFTSLDLETLTFVPAGPPQLYFDTWVLNLGSVALQLTAEGIEAEQTPVSQCVSWQADHICREQRPVGGFGIDPEHNHFHFAEFATYELRKVLHNGRVDYSTRGLVAAQDKVSFCLIDSQQERDDASLVPFYSTCGGVVQGVSAGWADIYDIATPGQAFPIGGLSDGRYALVIRLDYADRLYETDDTDNVVEVFIEVSGGVTQAAIVGRNYP